MSLHIVLYQPEIPANTGNIARTCAGTNTSLHLIRPLGFSTDDKMLKRAGLDYWDKVNITYYDDVEAFFEQHGQATIYYIETFGTKNYTEFDYSHTEEDIFFMFGRETTGIPRTLIEDQKHMCLQIPQSDNVRSLNLSNTAAIVIYEALRQQNFHSVK
ncbi:tRNA (uridine(34)/cytosine(34)/5-carboxymethylaminomethyluridine(34)-2'-O)-methyltransferase TrmL [Kurthia sibirica]|uniref:Putative tRNA (cytidine(34)-2'-O)-methyltransferase n=1 Tax=Kurthia sibirica TaxID=202750 RepID=A0A2U3AHA9_9BACL|nr:tRNA (uridine(34)/cytosine(34)/5-carboxymethylaminomethyluridine(34)-2'-O)-methyltransferase TrmL [Kurthia sibirica]PWI23897.1 tRNA (uridine(34)/cytosine(34)/5-carboxymethylaminomethyluridine(34)-2'-O)-methyltransferase TrmL [Kurthia sibirica]GEK34917.1 putative tRNA (cytidine(34)-2'-O)-methyltransferase [Kurthia sibirica]